jgi:hypothetical protein
MRIFIRGLPSWGEKDEWNSNECGEGKNGEEAVIEKEFHRIKLSF